jgi:uncharacterized membrane protein
MSQKYVYTAFFVWFMFGYLPGLNHIIGIGLIVTGIWVFHLSFPLEPTSQKVFALSQRWIGMAMILLSLGNVLEQRGAIHRAPIAYAYCIEKSKAFWGLTSLIIFKVLEHSANTIVRNVNDKEYQKSSTILRRFTSMFARLSVKQRKIHNTLGVIHKDYHSSCDSDEEDLGHISPSRKPYHPLSTTALLLGVSVCLSILSFFSYMKAVNVLLNAIVKVLQTSGIFILVIVDYWLLNRKQRKKQFMIMRMMGCVMIAFGEFLSYA